MKQPARWSVRFPSLVGLALACAVLLGGCAPQLGAVAPTSSARPSALATTTPTTGATPTAEPATPPVTPPAATAATPSAAPLAGDPSFYPDPQLTPGDVLPVTAAQVSVPGYSSKVRNVPISEKRQVYAEYRLAYPAPSGAYECDHFIPLCLGGSNSIKNLWPEPAPEFHWKDGLELYLWHEVRGGRIGLPEAQRQIRTDWYGYWVKAGKPGSKADADSVVVQSSPTRAAGSH